MKTKCVIALVILGSLTGCSKPPDLDAPCNHFGQYCPQYPVNEDVIQGNTP